MAADSNIPLANANIRLYRKDHGQIVYEDFFQSDAVGEILDVPLQTPPAGSSLTKEIENFETYHVDIRCNGYETLRYHGVQIYANIHTFLSLSLFPLRHDTSMEREYTIPAHATRLRKSSSSNLDISTFFGKQTSELDTSHDTLTTLLGYLKHVASYELDPTWPYDIIKVHILALLSDILQQWFSESDSLQGSNQTVLHGMETLRITEQYPVYDTICNVVDEVGQDLCLKYHQSPLFPARKLQEAGEQDMVEEHKKKHSIVQARKQDEVSITGIQLGEQGEPIRVIQNHLQTLAIYYPSISYCSANGVFDTPTKASIVSFQRLLGIHANGEGTALTLQLLDEMYEELMN